jgi:hypothetical protein
LPAQLTKAHGLLLTDVELLAGQLTDALSDVLELARLLAVNVCNALARLHHLAGGLLSEACLLDAQLPQALTRTNLLRRQVAVQARRALLQLPLLTSGLSLQLPGLCKLLRRVLAQPRLLRGNRGLLRAQLPNALRTSHLPLLLLLKRGDRIGLRLVVALA